MWRFTDVPFPDVVHNRIHSRIVEHTQPFQNLTSLLQTEEVPFFNAHYVNKWDVFEKLSAVSHLKPYLPDTYQLRSKQDLADALANYPSIFLKPVHGSQGKHIFRICKTDEAYLLDYTTFSHPFKKEYDTFYELFEALYLQLKKQGFIIQQAIPLQTYKQCPFDFRFLCHKTNELQWKVTSAVARVSQQGNFVSNIARGGEIYHPYTLLEQLYSDKQRKEILTLLKELSLDICRHLSSMTNDEGMYAEFGIDLAIDKEGKPWIIEVNTKPSKQSGDDLDTIRPSTKALLSYCMHIAFL